MARKLIEGLDSQLREVQVLVDDLQAFALQSERVLTRLDLRAAAQARHVARQLCTITPYLQLPIDEALRDAAAIKLAGLTTQARICLGRATAEASPRTIAQPASGVRRRDDRRDPTIDTGPIHRGATEPESRASDAIASDSSNGRYATEPETGVDAPSTAGGVRVATGGERERERDDAAACEQWKSLLAR